jgi:pimeloyl-ACP methyl ester carboxylesterase
VIAENDGVRLAYDVDGAGPPLLLIHGLGYGRTGWGGLPDRLARRFSVIRFDNRGVGDSDVPSGPYDPHGMAEDAVAVMRAAGFERAHVLGTSLGGMVAQELALSFPERVDRLVLACTQPAGADTMPLPQRAIDAFARFPTMEPAAGLRLMVENSLADTTVAERPELVDEVFAYRLENPPPLDGWLAQAQANLGWNVVDRLGELRMPTLVLTGTADNVVDPKGSDLLAERIPSARLERFVGCGHLFFWEQPQQVAAVLEEFLA